MKLTHSQKLKLANKLITPYERTNRTPLFQSVMWWNRKEAIKKRELAKFMRA